jgi:hypothetical protein
MLSLAMASTVLFSFSPDLVPETKAMQCAADVGIPYASDNFTDLEWKQFQECVLKQP